MYQNKPVLRTQTLESAGREAEQQEDLVLCRGPDDGSPPTSKKPSQAPTGTTQAIGGASALDPVGPSEGAASTASDVTSEDVEKSVAVAQSRQRPRFSSRRGHLAMAGAATASAPLTASTSPPNQRHCGF